MRLYPFILLFLPHFVGAQTNISGIVNSYHKVTEIVTAKACVRVDNTVGLVTNDLVMIVQMKGATINLTNTSSFGSVTAMNNAGNYELGTICSIRGDSVFLFKEIFQSYTVSDKVQLVKIPQYNSAIVTDTLKALAWDSAAGKGGVLALSVNDDLILNAPVYANNCGYKGGNYQSSTGTCFNFLPADKYFYNSTILSPQDGATKGESVANMAIAYTGGKGAAANGGGGGNNHNNGGGGGANLVAGGVGGGNSSAAGCTVANAGKGGYSLSSASGSKIFMGGGGGAGHANSGVLSTAGGSGGGIIFIQANTVYSNGFKIMSNGQTGSNAIGDGAGGGGAGGTVILNVNNYADALNTEAIGGDGGIENDDNTSQRCYGEGGGGSGGAVYYKTGTIVGTINIAGGKNGNRINSLNCGPLVVGANGMNGTATANYSVVQGPNISTTCGFILPTELIYFSVQGSNNSAIIEWKTAGVSEVLQFFIERKKENKWWEAIATKTSVRNVFLFTHQDKNLAAGIYFYRLKIISSSNTVTYSNTSKLKIGDERTLAFFPNPASTSINIIYPFEKGTILQIFDASAKLVKSKTFSSRQFSFKQEVSFLKKGIYWIVINDERQRLVVR